MTKQLVAREGGSNFVNSKKSVGGAVDGALEVGASDRVEVHQNCLLLLTQVVVAWLCRG